MTNPYEFAGTSPTADDDPPVRTIAQTRGSRVVAGATIITASIGVLYNLSSLSGALESRLSLARDLPYFHSAYFVSIAAWTLLFGMLVWQSTRLWRGFPGSGRRVIRLMLLEIALFLLISFLWLAPVIGRSVAATTGIAGGGFMPQCFVLLPLWGPLLLWMTGSNRD